MDLSSRGLHICENGTKTVTVDGKQYKCEWREGDLLRSRSKCYIHPHMEPFNYDGTLSGFIKIHPVIPETVGLYSGLPDKTGKNICLQDVIKYRPANSDSDKFLLVKWDEERATFKAGFATLWVIHDHCEVVGNLFENPELLQKIEQ